MSFWRTVFVDGVVKAGGFFFFVPLVIFVFWDMYSGQMQFSDVIPEFDRQSWVMTFATNALLYFLMSVGGGLIVGITIYYARLRDFCE